MNKKRKIISIKSNRNKRLSHTSYGMTPNEINKSFYMKKGNRSNDDKNNSNSGAYMLKIDLRRIRKRVKEIKLKKRPNNFGLLFKDTLSIINSHGYDSTFKYLEYTTPNWFRYTKRAKISVIIPLYKSNLVIKELIESWNAEDISCGDIEIIYVDDKCPNNSKQFVVDYWKSRNIGPVGRIYVNNKNKGYGLSCNVGAHNATGDYLIFLNADTVVTPGWIQPLIRLLRDKDVGIVGNLQLKQGGQHHGTIDSCASEWCWKSRNFLHIGRNIYEGKKLSKPLTLDTIPKKFIEDVQEVDMVTGCCFAIRKELFDYLGGFDISYRIGYWEDSDLCMRVKELGYKILFTPHSRIWHKLSHAGAGNHKYHALNRRIFENKWIKSGRIDDIIKNPRRQKPKISHILVKRSVSCGDVLVATLVCSALKKKYNNAKITFMSNHPDISELSEYVDENIVVDINANIAPYDFFVNLDFAYEKRPIVNILHAFAEEAGVSVDDCHGKLKHQPINNLPEKYITFHAYHSPFWKGMNLSYDIYNEVGQMLSNSGYKVVCIGTYKDHKLPSAFIDLRGKLNLRELVYVIKKAILHFGKDSFPMHVAQIVGTKCVIPFGTIHYKVRDYSNLIYPIQAKLDCIGCMRKKLAPQHANVRCDAEIDDLCMKEITAQEFYNSIIKAINDESHNKTMV